ncbi:MAG: CvpA family protein [Sulfurimonas sp.]|nr:CvpA family protein [Sulfurimonas sp.]MDQ7062574.1 CvpA family protein [Sulfurimonas sp.]
MMEINYFDIIVTIIILFLGLKGILNGFFKELFGLVGIIGGIFVASRLGDSVGTFLNDLIFNFDNASAVSFTGFIIVLALFWLLMIAIGMAFKHLTLLSGLGPFDKILGFVFGAGKFFFITAVIAHAAYNIKALKSVIDETSLKTSVLFPILTETGSYIMQLDPVGLSQDINKSASSLKSKASNIADDTMKQLQDSMPNMEK